MTLPERLRHLRVDVNGAPCGDLRRESQLVFSYGRDDASQPAVGLLMPPRQLGTWRASSSRWPSP